MIPEWNRFDICEAYNLIAHDYGLYDVIERLRAIPFKCAPAREFYKGLSANGQAIYDYHERLLTEGESTINSEYTS